MSNRWFRIGDLISVALCVLVAGSFLLVGSLRKDGDTVCVTAPDGDAVMSLAVDAENVFYGHNGLAVTVTVKDGRVCVSHADCPDQVCVATGWLSKNGQSAACLPAGIVVTVTTPALDDQPDTVVR